MAMITNELRALAVAYLRCRLTVVLALARQSSSCSSCSQGCRISDDPRLCFLAVFASTPQCPVRNPKCPYKAQTPGNPQSPSSHLLSKVYPISQRFMLFPEPVLMYFQHALHHRTGIIQRMMHLGIFFANSPASSMAFSRKLSRRKVAESVATAAQDAPAVSVHGIRLFCFDASWIR